MTGLDVNPSLEALGSRRDIGCDQGKLKRVLLGSAAVLRNAIQARPYPSASAEVVLGKIALLIYIVVCTDRWV